MGSFLPETMSGRTDDVGGRLESGAFRSAFQPPTNCGATFATFCIARITPTARLSAP